MTTRRAASLRSRFLLLVLLAVVLPLALAGWWVTRTAVRSQVEEIETDLEEGLNLAVRQIQGRWIRIRSRLLDLGEEWMRREATGSAPIGTADRQEQVREALRSGYGELSRAVQRLALAGPAGEPWWEVSRVSFDPIATGIEPSVLVREPLFARASGAEIGVIEAEVLIESLLDQQTTGARVTGLLLAAIDLESGASLLPLPFDPSLLRNEETLTWGGSRWLVRRRELSDPPVALVALAPLTPVIAPLEAAARRGLWFLLAVSVVAFAVAGLLIRRWTGSLEQLAEAATGVSRGELELQVQVGGEDEVGRLGVAFNRMTENLRSTLRELARRESLAMVGELAASLSHEVRNILTSVRLDLQRVEEALPEKSAERRTQQRALSEIARLDATVTSTLQMARGARFDPSPIDLLAPLAAAAHAAMPEIRARGATLEMPSRGRAVAVNGEADALEQLFLNLLLNAAQAVASGGRIEVRLGPGEESVVVSVVDNGEGMPEERKAKIFEPFYSTREGGTGLGLAVVQRIVRLHEGRISVESAPGRGTTVRVELPLEPRTAGLSV